MGSIPDIQTDEVEWLTSGTEIAVAFGKKGETLGTVEWIVLAESAARVRIYGGTSHTDLRELNVSPDRTVYCVPCQG